MIDRELMREWMKPIPGPLDHIKAWFTGEDFSFTYNRKWCWSGRVKQTDIGLRLIVAAALALAVFCVWRLS